MLEEFQQSSKELEAELEKEIDSTERRCKEIKIRNDALRQEVDEWKVKRLIVFVTRFLTGATRKPPHVVFLDATSCKPIYCQHGRNPRFPWHRNRWKKWMIWTVDSEPLDDNSLFVIQSPQQKNLGRFSRLEFPCL